MSIPEEHIDPEALKVVRRLVRAGYDAYLVGGCVRDLLLERKPKDFDIATSATPNEIRALFRNCRIIGRRFRLAHIFFGKKIIETATFRKDPREEAADPAAPLDAALLDVPDLDDNMPPDGGPASEAAPEAEDVLIRHDNVFGSAEEDARRRDFTINGLFYDVDEAKVIDYVVGLPDLERRLVRTIGDAEIRFREDPVRILRAIKFAARLDLTIEATTYAALLRHVGEIAKSAKPRVLEEIYRLLRGGAARRSFELLLETGALAVLAPQLAARMGNAELRAAMAATLAAVDERVAAGVVPSNAFLLAALCLPLAEPVLLQEEVAGDLWAVMSEYIAPVSEDIRPSRRDAELLRQLLLAQRRLMPSKKRRARPLALARREWFGEALGLFEILHHPEPGSELADEVGRWRRMEGEEQRTPPHAAHVANGHVASPEAAEGEPRRRRRRRGGRRRRRPGEAPSTEP